MKSQRVSALAKNNLKRTVREPAALFMILMFPVLLTLVFGFSFGAVGGSQSASYKVGVVNGNSSGQYALWSQRFIDNLAATQIIQVQSYPNTAAAQDDLVQGKVQAVIIIPANFGASCNSYWQAPTNPGTWENAVVTLYLDSGSLFATQAIPPIIQGALEATVYAVARTTIPGPVSIGSPSLVAATAHTTFDFMAPGLFAFAAIFLIMMVGQSFTLDRESGMLKRIYTTPTRPTEFITSHLLSNMVLAIIQVALVFVIALLVGYRPLGGIPGLAMAFFILAIFSLSCVGFGLITATIAKSPGAATGIAFIFVIPQMFLGTFVSAGLSTGAAAVGKIVPSYYVTDALTSLFLRGAPVLSSTILLDLGAVIVSSVIVLSLGMLLFQRYGRS